MFWARWSAFTDPVVAGSALIQACEKAGVTVPRYVDTIGKPCLAFADVSQILLP